MPARAPGGAAGAQRGGTGAGRSKKWPAPTGEAAQGTRADPGTRPLGLTDREATHQDRLHGRVRIGPLFALVLYPIQPLYPTLGNVDGVCLVVALRTIVAMAAPAKTVRHSRAVRRARLLSGKLPASGFAEIPEALTTSTTTSEVGEGGRGGRRSRVGGGAPSAAAYCSPATVLHRHEDLLGLPYAFMAFKVSMADCRTSGLMFLDRP